MLDSWLNYDTAKPAEEEANAYAQQHAKSRHKAMKFYVSDYTVERAFADLKRGFMSEYLNSGAATKGLLAWRSGHPRCSPPSEHAPISRATARARLSPRLC